MASKPKPHPEQRCLRFNDKIRWLITQAYGLRDREYFKLKVFSLPTLCEVDSGRKYLKRILKRSVPRPP